MAPLAVFIDRLRDAGYVDRQNVKIDYGFADGRHNAKGTIAGEWDGLNVDAIMAFGDQLILAVKKATAVIPIMMFACDELAVGFVNSLPGLLVDLGDITPKAATLGDHQ